MYSTRMLSFQWTVSLFVACSMLVPSDSPLGSPLRRLCAVGGENLVLLRMLDTNSSGSAMADGVSGGIGLWPSGYCHSSPHDIAGRCANTEHLILAFVELVACKHDFVGNVSASERGDSLRLSSSITCRRSTGESEFCGWRDGVGSVAVKILLRRR